MIPDELITAATEEANRAVGEYLNGAQFPGGIHAEVCRRALTAAFAKLPECEELRIYAKDGYDWRAVHARNDALAALARMVKE